MSANTEQRRQSKANWKIADPGNGGAIPVDRSGVVEMTGGGTRTLARPAKTGLELTLNGAATVTVTGGYNSEADTTLGIGSQGAPVVLKSVSDSSTTFAWRIVGHSSSGVTTGRIGVPLTSISKEDGTQMIKQASTTTGIAQLSNKNLVIYIPANSTAEAFAATVNVPSDVATEDNGNLVLNVVVSKGSDLDSLTLDAELYARNPDSASWSTDAYSGSAQAIVAAGTVLQYAAVTTPTVAISGSVAFVLTLGGTNDGDIVYIHDVYWTYTKS